MSTCQRSWCGLLALALACIMAATSARADDALTESLQRRYGGGVSAAPVAQVHDSTPVEPLGQNDDEVLHLRGLEAIILGNQLPLRAAADAMKRGDEAMIQGFLSATDAVSHAAEKAHDEETCEACRQARELARSKQQPGADEGVQASDLSSAIKLLHASDDAKSEAARQLVALTQEMTERARATVMAAKQRVAVAGDTVVALERQVGGLARQTSRSGFASLQSLGFTLRESLEEDGQRRPARIVWSRDLDSDDDAFSGAFALRWNAKGSLANSRDRAVSWNVFAAVFGDLADDREDPQNVLGAAGGLAFVLDWTPFEKRKWAGPNTRLLEGRLGARYTRSPKGDLERLAAELSFVPKWGSIAMGVRRGHEYGTHSETLPGGKVLTLCTVPRNFVSFQWQPTLTVAWGQNIQRGELEAESTHLRIAASVSARLMLDALGRMRENVWDGAKMPYIELTYLWLATPLESDTTHSGWSLRANFPLNAYWSIDVKYVDGYLDGDLTTERSITVALGLQF